MLAPMFPSSILWILFLYFVFDLPGIYFGKRGKIFTLIFYEMATLLSQPDSFIIHLDSINLKCHLHNTVNFYVY